MKPKNRYSFLIKPIQVLLDVLAIILVLEFISDDRFLDVGFLSYMIAFWLISTQVTKYYLIKRYTRTTKVFILFIKQLLALYFGFFAFFGVFREGLIVGNQFIVLNSILLTLLFLKLSFFFALRLYRSYGKNYRKVVLLGSNNSTKRIIHFFKTKKYLGYKYLGFFSDNKKKNRLGDINSSFQFILENQVDEIYCSIPEFTKEEIKKVTKFSNANNVSLKLIPDFEELYSKNRKVQYYDNALMVVDVGKLPFQYSGNIVLKRIFDILFSFFACLFVLSWMYPLLWLLIKIESKGPVIFKQKREGLHGEEFVCYKFRSMRLNTDAHNKHASKGDPRVTKIGAFIRRTSLDEIPQFINVLKGDMSVVGPRPHVEALSNEYKEEVEVENYIKRYAMKPGITGLAQVSGYRGEVIDYSDIKNRLRMDVFYIENWSFLLDIKIIFMTVFNVFKGEDKAY